MKKSTFIVMLVCILSLAFIGCEQENLNIPPENTVEPEALTGTVYHERVTGSDIPEISALVADVMGGEKGVLKVSTHNLKKPTEYTVNWDEVNVITDSVGVENYAFRLETPESDPLVFYNLIATRDENGELLDPVIAEYVTDPTFYLQWRLDADKLRDYTGEVYFYDVSGEEYSKNGKGAELDMLRDGAPCPSITFGPTGPGFNIPNIYCWSYVTYGLCETQINYDTGSSYHGSGSCGAGTGSPIMGYGVSCSTNPGGGGGDVQKGGETARCPTGGGRPALPGGVPVNPSSPGDADFGSFVGWLDNKIQLSTQQEDFLEDGPEVELVLELQLFLDMHKDVPNVKTIAKDIVEIRMDGTPQEIQFTRYVLANDFESAFNTMMNQVRYTPYQECPNPPCEGQFDAVVVLSIQVVNSAYDGVLNMFTFLLEAAVSDEREGRSVRNFLKGSGINIPSDVTDETLEQLFQIRSRDRAFVVEPANQDFIDELKDAGFSLLDIVTVVSPSRGGGAYFFIKSGVGAISMASLSKYLKVLAKGNWKVVNESMSDAAKSYQEFISGMPWNQSFELNNVRFDAIRNGILADAKSGYLNFVNTNGEFQDFFTGQADIISQARRQINAAEGLPVEWHFEHDIVRKAFEKLLKDEGLNNLYLIHTPR